MAGLVTDPDPGNQARVVLGVLPSIIRPMGIPDFAKLNKYFGGREVSMGAGGG